VGGLANQSLLVRAGGRAGSAADDRSQPTPRRKRAEQDVEVRARRDALPSFGPPLAQITVNTPAPPIVFEVDTDAAPAGSGRHLLQSQVRGGARAEQRSDAVAGGALRPPLGQGS
jgi:hypothetical protein